MSTAPSTSESLNAAYDALQEERKRTMDPAYLAANINQRAHLAATADRSKFPKPGDTLPDFKVTEVEQGALSLHKLLQNGPLVLVFFRFAGCPACNIALPYYARTLAPALTAQGATLLALSPQVPEKLVEIKTKHSLPFLVATDHNNALARHFGIAFEPLPETRALALSKGSDLGKTLGTGSWELPMPAVVIIGQDQHILFADVSPDWLNRTETPDVLAALRQTETA